MNRKLVLINIINNVKSKSFLPDEYVELKHDSNNLPNLNLTDWSFARVDKVFKETIFPLLRQARI